MTRDRGPMTRDRGPLGPLCEALGLGSTPEQILTDLEQLYARVDEAVSKGAAGLDLPCQPGCDACCHEAVFVSAPEFLAVADYLLRTATRDQRRRYVSEMRVLAERFEDELLLLEELAGGPERDEVAQRVRFRCPLLGLDGRCSVYPVRELNARTFGMSRDEHRDSAFGCALTHDRLRILQPGSQDRLVGARAMRRWLRTSVPGTATVRVYPAWFTEFGHWLIE